MVDDAQRFQQFEEDLDVFSLRINDVPIWERVRFDVFREIQERNGTGQAHTDVNEGWDSYLKGGLLWLRNLFVKNPFVAGSSDVMFVGNPRRQRESDGRWWDIYCDPIHNHCDMDSVHFEFPHMLEHKKPPRTDRLY